MRSGRGPLGDSEELLAMERYWDRAAVSRGAWYVATRHQSADGDFYARGARETDALHDQLQIRPHGTIVEIGCGLGRMTGRLSELYDRVIACDISSEMLSRAREQLSTRTNITYRKVPGNGELPMLSASVSVVLSYITLQHVPEPAYQLRYLHEGIRLLQPGGVLAYQVRANGPVSRSLEVVGHLAHQVQLRRTLHRAWRGSHLSDELMAAELAALPPTYRATQHRTSKRHLWLVIERLAADRSDAHLA